LAVAFTFDLAFALLSDDFELTGFPLILGIAIGPPSDVMAQ
jgi:hypothetical protein